MAARINKEVVEAMGKTGFSRAEIARRLKCSERQIRRILGPGADRSFSRIIETAETDLRECVLNFESGQTAGQRFGVSRQAIFQTNNNRSN